MVLSNSEILNALQKGYIIIEPTPEIPSFEKPGGPFNTTALDLSNPDGGFAIEPGKFVISNTMGKVHFPIKSNTDNQAVLERVHPADCLRHADQPLRPEISAAVS